MNDRAAMTEALRRFNRIAVPLDGRRAAAVAIAVSDDGFLLTRRTSKLRAHAGQFALPGGRPTRARTRSTPPCASCARRSAPAPGRADCLGILDDYPTRSGYVITPVVVWLSAGRELEANPDEVAELYQIPLASLDATPRFITIPESDRPVIQLPLVGHFVHAPTAAVLYQFREVALHGRETRVDHLEQPVFAWR